MTEDRDKSAILAEIVRLIEKLHNKGFSPIIHGIELIVFGDRKEELFEFIRSFSVLKKPENIRQILYWKLNTLNTVKEDGPPLSGIPFDKADMLYNSIFDQRKFSEKSVTPINIVLFRRGTRGQELTDILKILPNINTTILLSATDDSRSWFNASRIFNSTGIPSAGKALVALATDRQVKELLSLRFSASDFGISELKKFESLIKRLREPGNNNIEIVGDSIRKIFIAAMKINEEKRQKVINYLAAFFEIYREIIKSPLRISFSINDLPLRSLVILGAYYYSKKTKKDTKWQEVLNDLADNLVDIRKGNKVLLLTEERQHIVALDDQGYVYFSEIAIKQFGIGHTFLGIWLINKRIDDEFIKEFSEKIGNNSQIQLRPIVEASENVDDRYKIQVMKTILKVDLKYCNQIASEFDNICSSHRGKEENKIKILKSAKEALLKADLILYSDEFLETSVGGALIVPGVCDAIENKYLDKKKLKICLTQDENVITNKGDYCRQPESIHRYATGVITSGEKINSWENVDKHIDYVIGLISNQDKIIPLLNLQKNTNHKIFTQYVNSDISVRQGFFPAKALAEVLLSLVGINRAGIIVDQNYGLLLEECTHSSDIINNINKYVLGLFDNDPTKQLINNVLSYFSIFKESGGFVFDVDLTMLPKEAELLTDYPELAYLVMQLLRYQHKVGIISGNSAEAQIPRIVDAISREMKGDQSGLKNLIFYVDGGATKIYFNDKGDKINDPNNEFNIENAMDCRSQEFKSLKKAVNSSLQYLSNLKLPFNLSVLEQQKYLAYVKNKNPDLKIIAPWEIKEKWRPKWLTPSELEKLKVENGKIIVPWIEIRGKRKVGKKIVSSSIAIKPIPIVEDKDVRDTIHSTIKNNL